MSTHTPRDPTAMARQITSKMPRSSHVTVIPRNKGGSRCPARAADYYEVRIYPVDTWRPAVFDDIVKAILAWPGCVQAEKTTDEYQRPMIRARIAHPASQPPSLGEGREQRGDTPHQRLSPHQPRRRPRHLR